MILAPREGIEKAPPRFCVLIKAGRIVDKASYAYPGVGSLDKARGQVEQLLKISDTAELHSLLGEIEESAKNYLVSVAQFEQAAHMDPSESNILAWGVELLLHQTFEPAVEVFRSGIARCPRSTRVRPDWK